MGRVKQQHEERRFSVSSSYPSFDRVIYGDDDGSVEIDGIVYTPFGIVRAYAYRWIHRKDRTTFQSSGVSATHNGEEIVRTWETCFRPKTLVQLANRFAEEVLK